MSVTEGLPDFHCTPLQFIFTHLSKESLVPVCGGTPHGLLASSRISLSGSRADPGLGSGSLPWFQLLGLAPCRPLACCGQLCQSPGWGCHSTRSYWDSLFLPNPIKLKPQPRLFFTLSPPSGVSRFQSFPVELVGFTSTQPLNTVVGQVLTAGH